MLSSDELIQAVVDCLPEIEMKLSSAASGLTSISVPEGIGPLRLSRREVDEILTSFSLEVSNGHGRSTVEDPWFQDGMAEMADQLFLHQFAPTASEVSAEFVKDISRVLALNPALFPQLSPLVTRLKAKTVTNSQHFRKFDDIADIADDLVTALEDKVPYYVLRILDEIADFSGCVIAPMEVKRVGMGTPANDNVLSVQ